jgi:hypothetical protein
MPDSSYSVCIDILKEQLEDERKRLASRQQRAAAIVTSSLAIAAFLFTMTGFVVRDGKFTFTDEERTALVVAESLLVVAAGIGIVIAFRSIKTAVIELGTLRQWLVSAETTARHKAQAEIGGRLLELVRSIREANQGWETHGVNWALAAEGLALLAVAFALGHIVLARH